ncbi:discoidin domain-containing protein [Bacteroides thetaiotaomicron]|uniref:discoidin domain-containing protein n=1 Tax=Bacteroides thetaiotaomicron TaxID=818 RepID=UPI0035698556
MLHHKRRNENFKERLGSSVLYAQEASGEGAGNGLAKCLIDGDTETFWHAKWQGGSDPLPYDIVIDMKQNIQIAQVELLPRGRGSNNPIKVVEFAASEDNVNWTPIGRFGFTNQDAALEYYVKSIKARYIRLTIPDDGGNSTVAAIRELDVKGTIIN